MDFENSKADKEFKPCWMLFCSYFKGENRNTFGHISIPLNANDFTEKPEITTSLLNLMKDALYENCKLKNVVILNSQIIWANELLK